MPQYCSNEHPEEPVGLGDAEDEVVVDGGTAATVEVGVAVVVCVKFVNVLEAVPVLVTATVVNLLVAVPDSVVEVLVVEVVNCRL